MDALSVDAIPVGDGWQYEPKWDGFRCVTFRNGAGVEGLVGGPGFTGRAPGGPSRWSTKRSTEWQPLQPKLVVEVQFDHVSAGRFRHGTTLLRWRPDKAPSQCTMDQLAQKSSRLLALLEQPRKSTRRRSTLREVAHAR